MKRPLLSTLLLPFLLLTALSGQELRAQDPSYVGTWTIDNAKLLELNEEAISNLVPPDAPPEIAEQMRLMFSSLGLEITLEEDGTATGITKAPDPLGRGEPRVDNTSGSWKVENGEISITMKSVNEPEADTQSGKLEGKYLMLYVKDGPLDLKIPLIRKGTAAAQAPKTPDLTGTWRVNPDRLLEINAEVFDGMIPEGMPEVEAKKFREQVIGTFTKIRFELELGKDGKASGTFTMPSMGLGEKPQTDRASGTWKVDGNKFSATMKGDGDKEPKTESGTYADGYLVLEIKQGGLTVKLPLQRVVKNYAGTWVLDSAMMVKLNLKSMVPADMPEDQRSMVLPMIEQMLGSMQMEIVLTDDGKARALSTMNAPGVPGANQEKEAVGTWKVDGEVVSITMKEEGDPEARTVSGKMQGDRLVLRVEEEGTTVTIPMKRR